MPTIYSGTHCVLARPGQGLRAFGSDVTTSS